MLIVLTQYIFEQMNIDNNVSRISVVGIRGETAQTRPHDQEQEFDCKTYFMLKLRTIWRISHLN